MEMCKKPLHQLSQRSLKAWQKIQGIKVCVCTQGITHASVVSSQSVFFFLFLFDFMGGGRSKSKILWNSKGMIVFGGCLRHVAVVGSVTLKRFHLAWGIRPRLTLAKPALIAHGGREWNPPSVLSQSLCSGSEESEWECGSQLPFL